MEPAARHPTASKPTSFLTDLLCPECGRHYPASQVQTFCQACSSPLLAQYDLLRLHDLLSPAEVVRRGRGIWRWAELLPVSDARYRLTLGEGDTALLPLPRLGSALAIENLLIKDESTNPTGSFKARGLAAAVGRALELGIRTFAIPTAGNAGGALAAYAARGKAEAHIFMPADAPIANQREVQAAGAELHLVNGLISDAARLAASQAAKNGWFDLSTFKEPYRVEGKKTLGFELAEALNWRLPDVIIYPTGGGTGLVGMWKAFDELQALGWIGSHRPRMVSVQASGCAPVVRAFTSGAAHAEPWQQAHTLAAGLRVPMVFAGRIILRIIRQSGGTALAVDDEEMTLAQRRLAVEEGIFAAPEGAATLAAAQHLAASGWIKPGEQVVLFNTGSGIKYI
jgi:threonine synthase